MKGKEENTHFIAHYRQGDQKEQSVIEHLENTAKITEKLAEEIGLGLCGRLIGLSHDLGKQRNRFDNYIRGHNGILEKDPDADTGEDGLERRGDIDHSSAGSQIIFRKLAAMGEEYRLLGQMLALIVASHHGGLIDCLTYDGYDNFSRRINKEEKETGATEAYCNLPEDFRQKIDDLIEDPELLKELKDVWMKIQTL